MFPIFALVNFPGHHGQTSPPNTLDKVPNQELSLSGFSSHSKIESSKVSWAAALPLDAATCASLIHAIKTSLLVMPGEEWIIWVTDDSDDAGLCMLQSAICNFNVAMLSAANRHQEDNSHLC